MAQVRQEGSDDGQNDSTANEFVVECGERSAQSNSPPPPHSASSWPFVLPVGPFCSTADCNEYGTTVGARAAKSVRFPSASGEAKAGATLDAESCCTVG